MPRTVAPAPTDRTMWRCLRALEKLATTITNELHALQGRALTHRGESEALNANISADRARERADRPGNRPGKGLYANTKSEVLGR